MSLQGKLRTTGQAVRTMGYYLTIGAMTAPGKTRRFLGEMANTVADYDWPKLRLPELEIGGVVPGTELGAVTLPSTSYTQHELPPFEYLTLALMVRSLKPRMIFEFGTNRGRTTRLLAEQSPVGCRVHTLDLPPERMLEGGAFSEADAQLVGEAFRGQPCAGKITQLLADSRAFDISPYTGRTDLIFIDADHSYDGVRSDTERALRMARPGGLVVWDDYNTRFPGIVIYLEELGRTQPVRRIRGTRFAYLQTTA